MNGLELVGNEKSATRFVILSQPRCGTHRLRSCIDNHPDANCIGEVCNADAKLRRALQERRINTTNKLVQWVFERLQVKAAGFVLHVDQVQYRSPFKSVWRWLAEQQDVCVIRLSRTDVLAQWISAQRANKSGQWQVYGKETIREPGPITINLDDLLAWRKNMKESLKLAMRYVAHLPRLSIEFEDQTNRHEETMHRVFEFLRLKYVDVQPDTKRQTTKPPELCVTNPEVIPEARSRLHYFQ